jgi:hypothetical protein
VSAIGLDIVSPTGKMSTDSDQTHAPCPSANNPRRSPPSVPVGDSRRPSVSDHELVWLQSWYLEQCDGDWEHEFGITIGTLDNPGWEIKVDLAETDAANMSLPLVKVERSEHDWIHYKVENGKFEGFGGPHNLRELLSTFRALLTDSHSKRRD